MFIKYYLGLYFNIYLTFIDVDLRYTLFDSQLHRYYSLKILPVTDEEYEAVKEAYNRLSEVNTSTTEKITSEPKENGVATFMTVIAVIIYICGFVSGAVGHNIYNSLVIWIGAFIGGSFFIGFAQIIKLLHEIKLK